MHVAIHIYIYIYTYIYIHIHIYVHTYRRCSLEDVFRVLLADARQALRGQRDELPIYVLYICIYIYIHMCSIHTYICIYIYMYI